MTEPLPMPAVENPAGMSWLAELRGTSPCEPSAAMRDRVVAARDRQARWLAPWRHATSAEMGAAATRATCPLSPAAERHLIQLVAARRWLIALAIDRIIKVARTIADLAGSDPIERAHWPGPLTTVGLIVTRSPQAAHRVQRP